MSSLRRLGLVGIIAACAVDCSKPIILNKHDLHRGRTTYELLSENSKHNGEMLFVPGRSYNLNDCLVGKYQAIALPMDSLKTRILVQYLDSRDNIYRQALFSARKEYSNVGEYYVMKLDLVEFDWNNDGIRDMFLITEAAIDTHGKRTERLVLRSPNNLPMTDYFTKNVIEVDGSKPILNGKKFEASAAGTIKE